MDVNEYKRRVAGARSRVAGQTFENAIEAACRWYEIRGTLKATKTPEPMKPLGKPNAKGQFMACYTKKAQVDFCGTMIGGLSIRFEAKHTADDRIERRRVNSEQQKDLRCHSNLGAVCFVLVCFGFTNFYRVPWIVWDNMKEIYGRLYVTEEDLAKYRIPYESGIVKFMDGIEGGGHP